jgi:thioesterase domain-containing protein
LGGFSGGGIAAFEMARQLIEMGEEIRTVILLDTPLPVREIPSRRDRLKIHGQRLARQGPSYLTDFVRARVAWELEKFNSRGVQAKTDSGSPAEFRSDEVRAAFEGALPLYSMGSLPVHVQLFRPRQHVAYDLGGGRILNEALEFLLTDNGWTDWVRELQVSEVPGTHDSMVLEPNVRVLASRLRVCLDEADAKAHELAVAGPR